MTTVSAEGVYPVVSAIAMPVTSSTTEGASTEEIETQDGHGSENRKKQHEKQKEAGRCALAADQGASGFPTLIRGMDRRALEVLDDEQSSLVETVT